MELKEVKCTSPPAKAQMWEITRHKDPKYWDTAKLLLQKALVLCQFNFLKHNLFCNHCFPIPAASSFSTKHEARFIASLKAEMSKMFVCKEECPSLKETMRKDVRIYYQRQVGHNLQQDLLPYRVWMFIKRVKEKSVLLKFLSFSDLPPVPR